MLFIAAMLALAIIVALILRRAYGKEMMVFEMGCMVAAVLLISGIGYAVAIHKQSADTEILSGKVTSKERDVVHCRHAYPCNCHSVGSGKNSHIHCDTCYEHAFDVDWNVIADIGSVSIETLDSQGLLEPKRWSIVKIGDPFSESHGYTNWIKAVPDSLFKRISKESVPVYPDQIYDYYHVDRVVSYGAKMPEQDRHAISDYISLALRDVAKKKEVNLVLVVTDKDPMFEQDLKAAWINGRKNDLVIVVGTKSYPTIDWVEVFGWSTNDLVEVTTRDDIKQYGKIDNKIVDIAISDINKLWQRQPMEKYKYLKEEIEPSTFAIVIILILVIVALAGLGYYFVNNNERDY